ncbi:unnamed protein product [Coffea canephora]|uniref:Uncharacterized protein n=1 Tax=Coffea canephora TaxID=49390 RepID=A0A068U6Q3_COFCA|nr:unnamed protein product [Coffea canephora]
MTALINFNSLSSLNRFSC